MRILCCELGDLCSVFDLHLLPKCAQKLLMLQFILPNKYIVHFCTVSEDLAWTEMYCIDILAHEIFLLGMFSYC